MQKLQPRIKAIQERYKKYKVNDPKKQEMNQEMMALYKEHGVNPLGGCLPILLQMPILVAFYNVLTVAIDLRQVSFLWIPDLSQYDKTFVLVIIMVVTQFLMQKLTPTPSADPAQAKLFMLMPLVFGFMFAKVASGLVLYWLTGNLIGIIQQVFLNKYGLAAKAPAPVKK
jgi:YidC/Oxa1 family membrane protein insertase